MYYINNNLIELGLLDEDKSSRVAQRLMLKSHWFFQRDCHHVMV